MTNVPDPDEEIDKPDSDTPIWRYMDLADYVSILERDALFFPTAAMLEDEFEGTYSRATVQKRRDSLKEMVEKYTETDRLSAEDFEERMAAANEAINYFTFISSWHENEHQSAAMWRLYLASNKGVAIKTTVGKLERSLEELGPSHLTIGRVDYLDYTEDEVPHGFTHWPYFRKRKSFEHEQEVRAVVVEAAEAMHAKSPAAESPPGRYEPVSVDELIETVYVAPSAPDWVAELIGGVNETYAISPDLRHGTDEEPLF